MTASAGTAPCPEAFVALAERIAAAAGETARAYFRTPIDIDDKPDDTPVTRADREAETRMREIIAAAQPKHGVIGEEHGSDRPGAEFVWVLDPIDGTKRFITGNPLFGSLVALLQGGRPILGIIDMPVLGERWTGAAGRATRFQDRRGVREVRTRPCARLDQATLTASSPHMFGAQEFPAFERVRGAVKMVLYGGDCFNYGTLACGYTDLAIEADMDVYDFLASVPVVTGAGGVMTDWRGRPLGLETDGRVIGAGDRRAHEAALALLDHG
jgi:histidinol phosphatase-like enzyme (inositol monophosphatase family)